MGVLLGTLSESVPKGAKVETRMLVEDMVMVRSQVSGASPRSESGCLRAAHQTPIISCSLNRNFECICSIYATFSEIIHRKFNVILKFLNQSLLRVSFD